MKTAITPRLNQVSDICGSSAYPAIRIKSSVGNL
jgi:hypothetical protein